MIAVFVISGLLWATSAPSHKDGGSAAFVPSTALTVNRTLERLDETKLRQVIHSRHGKSLFVNVWATWCEPCVEEFPDIVKLSNELHDKNIEFVGVSGDDFDDEASKVIPFIEKQKAYFKFYIAKLEGEDTFINAFNERWGGGIPATFVYDSRGKLKAMLVGKQSYQNLKAAIAKVLEK